MQTEYIYPVIGDRDTPDNWIDAGAKDAREVAHEYVVETLARHHPDHIDPVIDKTFSFDEAPASHQYIQERKNFGKVLLIP